ncbi:hypothetical protein COY95_01430 [Candidatus Woesearchaeota archaeon CG_4_10_14_0_8_um_filter_47_5]|nr:MAG: hypothetical protein COY95_01430 [Candidatus Woesearchaeota archaeon CG_4_10_14_0_8_um_filter_47_5]
MLDFLKPTSTLDVLVGQALEHPEIQQLVLEGHNPDDIAQKFRAYADKRYGAIDEIIDFVEHDQYLPIIRAVAPGLIKRIIKKDVIDEKAIDTSFTLEYLAKALAVGYIAVTTKNVSAGDLIKLALHEGLVSFTRKIPLVGGLVSAAVKFAKPYRDLAVKAFDLDNTAADFAATYRSGADGAAYTPLPEDAQQMPVSYADTANSAGENYLTQLRQGVGQALAS